MPRSKTRRQNKRKGTRKQFGGGMCRNNDPFDACPVPSKRRNAISNWDHDFGDVVWRGKDKYYYCERCNCFVKNPKWRRN